MSDDKMAGKRASVLVLALLATAGGVFAPTSPAQAASAWDLTNANGRASGTLTIRSGGWYDFAGTVTVSQDDGQCYYMRFFRFGQLSDPGYGVNSARQCGAGSLPIKASIYSYTLLPVAYGLCKAAPGTPEESPYTAFGSNCARPASS